MCHTVVLTSRSADAAPPNMAAAILGNFSRGKALARTSSILNTHLLWHCSEQIVPQYALTLVFNRLLFWDLDASF